MLTAIACVLTIEYSVVCACFLFFCVSICRGCMQVLHLLEYAPTEEKALFFARVFVCDTSVLRILCYYGLNRDTVRDNRV